MMADEVLSPDKRVGNPQNKGKLLKDINEGLAEFSPVVEVARIIGWQKNKKVGILVTDFIKFRDLMAHKPVRDLGYVQMVCAFVIYCRTILELEKKSYQPASTKDLCVTFARIADINVVVCATWLLNMLKNNQCSKTDIANFMTKQVKMSSFSSYKFTPAINGIDVTYNGETKPFDINLLIKLAEVLKTPVTYNRDEIEEFKEFYKQCHAIARSESTRVELRGVLSDIESRSIESRSIESRSKVDDLSDSIQTLSELSVS